MTKKKMNVWLKLTLILLGSALVGGVIGFLGSWFLEGNTEKITIYGGRILEGIQKMSIPAMIVVAIVSIAYEEWNLSQMRKIGHMILTTGYSIPYIEEGHALSTFILSILFLVLYCYDCFWQARLVKETQKIFPQLQGDPSSVKFHQQWLDSCDEAEKEYIYQSAYKCYIQMGKWVQILLLITMLGQLMFQTGVMAILVVAVIWLVMTTTYLKSCVQLKGKGIK